MYFRISLQYRLRLRQKNVDHVNIIRISLAYVVDTVTCWFDKDTDVLLIGIVRMLHCLGYQRPLGMPLLELLRTEWGFTWKVTVELLTYRRPASKTWIDFFPFTLVIPNITFWKEAKKNEGFSIRGLKTFKKKSGFYQIASAHLKAVNRVVYHLCNFKNFTVWFLTCWRVLWNQIKDLSLNSHSLEMAAISHRLSQLKMFWKQVQRWVAKETEAFWVVKLDKRYKTSSLGSLIP